MGSVRPTDLTSNICRNAPAGLQVKPQNRKNEKKEKSKFYNPLNISAAFMRKLVHVKYF